MIYEKIKMLSAILANFANTLLSFERIIVIMQELMRFDTNL